MTEDDEMKKFEMFEKFLARNFHQVRKQLSLHKQIQSLANEKSQKFTIKGLIEIWFHGNLRFPAGSY